MARRRRGEPGVFGLAFLDAMTCGLGAVILLYMIINASVALRAERAKADVGGEAEGLEAAVLAGHRDLVDLRDRLRRAARQEAEAQVVSVRLLAELASLRRELADAEATTLARREHVDKLKTDLKSLEEDTRRLAAAIPEAEEERGERPRSFVGDGDRQYLTGLKVGGRRILLLVDVSASMLGEDVVNVLVRRNLPPERKVLAAKWQRTVATVDWLTTQLPAGSTFQAYAFAEDARPLVAGSAGTWLASDDADRLEAAVAALRALVPDGGTNLDRAFAVARTLEPRPDNLILITDGLPTLGREPVRGGKVSGKKRLELFEQATRQLAADVPVNVILLPMAGDPMAASAFWKLAVATRGSFLSPARDWP